MDQMVKGRFKNSHLLGTRVVQLFKHPTLILAQVTLSWFVGSSPALGSALAVQSLLEILSVSLSVSLPHSHVCGFSLKINI